MPPRNKILTTFNPLHWPQNHQKQRLEILLLSYISFSFVTIFIWLRTWENIIVIEVIII